MTRLDRQTIELRGGPQSPVRPVTVNAWRFKDWAVHAQVEGVDGLWNITLLPLGLRLPSAWASFRSLDAAIRAMIEIANMRNSWHRVEQSDFTRDLKSRVMMIVLRHGAIAGPVGFVQRADLNMLGLHAGRLNRYQEIS